MGEYNESHNSDVGFLLKTVNDSLRKLANENFNEITFSQMGIVNFLAEKENHEATQKEIEIVAEVSHPTITGLVQRLEKKGIVQTEISVQRRLTKTVKLAQKGLNLYKESEKERKIHENMLKKGFSQEEKNLLLDFLQRIKNNISEFESLKDS